MNTRNSGNVPAVSIGLPVYNGGDLLGNALDSLLSQEFTDFEVIISDNASTDTTEKLCRDYAARDGRITYIRRDRNYGIVDNGRNTMKRARGKYFSMASHDDWWDPRFIGACVARLDANPSAVLATTDIDFFRPDGTPAVVICPPVHTVGMGLRDRVAALFHEVNAGYHMYGVFRREALLSIDLDVECFAADLVYLLQLMFLGEVEFVPHKLFRYRFVKRTVQEHADAYSTVQGECRPTKLYTILTINLLRAIQNARIDSALKRVLMSDMIAIIAVKNPEWREHILLENTGLFPFVNPQKEGVLPILEADLVAVFAALLLPYCRPGAPYERMIDFSEIEGFDEIALKDRAKPSPGYKEFIDRFIYLVEHEEYAGAIDYYDAYRGFQPDLEPVRRAGAVVEKLRARHAKAPRTPPEPWPRLRIAFQHRPPLEDRSNWDILIQHRLRDRLVARGHEVSFVGQIDGSLRDYDIIHLFSSMVPDGGDAPRFDAITSNIPIVVTALPDAPSRVSANAQRWFGIFETYLAQGQSPELFERLRKDPGGPPPPAAVAAIPAARRADRVVACGPAQALMLQSAMPGAAVAIVPFGIDGEQPDVSGELFENAFKVKNFVLCSCPLEPQSNQLMLLKALENEEIPVVLISGGPADAPEYAKLCQKMRRKGPTIFTGSITDEMLASAYRAARLFCLPSWYDAPGLVTLEAASFGCAVVASREGCIGDYLQDLCEYCEPDSPESIRSAVLKAFREGPATDLQKRAASYTWEAAAERIETVYREVLREKRVEV